MTDARFEQLMGMLLDQELTPEELAELVDLLKDSPDRQQELDAHLQSSEALAQAHDNLRSSSLFIATLESRMSEDPFVSGVRSALSTGGEPTSRLSIERAAWWYRRVAAAAIILLVASVVLLRPTAEPRVATITGLNGAVLWTGTGGHLSEDLAVAIQLPGGTIEGMSPESWVELRFHDGTTITLSGNSMLTFSDDGQKVLRLKEGSISADVTPQPTGKPMLVHTRSADFEVLGTRFEIEAELTSTTLNVNEGSVRAKHRIDQSTVDVPAKHRVVASPNRALVSEPVPDSVTHWKSQLHLGPEGLYGEWQAGRSENQPPRLGTIPHPVREGLTIYAMGMGISRKDQPPVELKSGARFRVHGHIDASRELWFGVTLRRPNGEFAGRFQTTLPAERFASGQPFEVVVNPSDFELVPELHKWAHKLPSHPEGLIIESFWCHSLRDHVGLYVISVELLANEPAK